MRRSTPGGRVVRRGDLCQNGGLQGILPSRPGGLSGAIAHHEVRHRFGTRVGDCPGRTQHESKGNECLENFAS